MPILSPNCPLQGQLVNVEATGDSSLNLSGFALIALSFSFTDSYIFIIICSFVYETVLLITKTCQCNKQRFMSFKI